MSVVIFTLLRVWLERTVISNLSRNLTYLIAILISGDINNTITAQQLTDTTKVIAVDTLKPSTKIVAPTKPHSPKKATIMSAIIPGSGQIYNKKYWKAPILYAGLVGLGYSFNFNQTRYVQYRNAYKVRLLNGSGTLGNYPTYSDNDLNTLQQYYHRYRDLTVIGASLLYLLNIIDASVDAHLYDFKIDDDNLSFQVQPVLIPVANLSQYSTGLSLSIRF